MKKEFDLADVTFPQEGEREKVVSVSRDEIMLHIKANGDFDAVIPVDMPMDHPAMDTFLKIRKAITNNEN